MESFRARKIQAGHGRSGLENVAFEADADMSYGTRFVLESRIVCGSIAGAKVELNFDCPTWP
jgi:hypothetical protein